MNLPVPTNGLPKPSLLAAYQRGRLQVLTMVLVTAAYLFHDVPRKLWTEGYHALTPDRIVHGIILGSVCWFVAKGGKLSGGCFTIVYGSILFVSLFVAVGSLISRHTAGKVGSIDVTLGDSWRSAFQFVVIGLWAAFSFWVLVYSKDAQLYLRARRRELTKSEANTFEWPPAHRRQG